MTTTNPTLLVRVAAKHREATDICSFELADPDGRPLPPFTAGAHIDVHLGDGLLRPYSLCNDPAERHRYRIAVLLEPASRGGSAAMHRLEVGAVLRIGHPRNLFPLVEDGGHSALFAGGIGITPILCMAERLAGIGAPFTLHYCTRSAGRTAFAARIRSSAFADRVHIHHDDGPDAGTLDLRAAVAAWRPDAGHLYVCGPAGFIDAVLAAARAAGWPEQRLHREFFAPPASAADGDGRAFEVQIASSGAVIPVHPHQTIVSALAAAGIDVPVSCEQGICGTCRTGVVAGIPDHRDMFLTDDEKSRSDQILPCCSRSKSARLVLDL